MSEYTPSTGLPTKAAQWMVERCGIAALKDPVVLNPCAGDGALVRAVWDANPNAFVVAGAADALHASRLLPLESQVSLCVIASDSQDYAACVRLPCDAAVMDLPFETADTPRWVDVVRPAWEAVIPGGRLFCLTWLSQTWWCDSYSEPVRDLIRQIGGTTTDVPLDLLDPGALIDLGRYNILPALIEATKPEVTR